MTCSNFQVPRHNLACSPVHKKTKNKTISQCQNAGKGFAIRTEKNGTKVQRQVQLSKCKVSQKEASQSSYTHSQSSIWRPCGGLNRMQHGQQDKRSKKQVVTNKKPESTQPHFKSRILKSRAAARENPNHIRLIST